MNRKTYTILGAAALAVAALFAFEYAGTAYAASKTVTTSGGVELHDVKAQTLQFMRWYSDIELTPAQERIRVEALSAIPAPCCSDNSAATCCCPCNMAKSVWGLSKYLITEKGAGVEEVRQAAKDWFQFINPEGFSGDTCYIGGCGRAFHENGCGGMRQDRPVF
ncbi:MAG TPA: hypothetical protein VLF66_03130 [Thermoanaerobaculia bacterium]|nr:hypothetical protein [Thermoanaerobaculia bacterium]